MDEPEKVGPKKDLPQLFFVAGHDGKFHTEVGQAMVYTKYWDIQYDWQDKVYAEGIQKVLRGEASPIWLYLSLYDIGVDDAAARIGLSRRRVRRHMTPEGFKTASVDHLQRYADIFGVPVAAFFCFAEQGLPPLPLRMDIRLNGLAALVKPGEIGNEWNFLRTPARRTL